jgi:Cu/Zn superoxide dismutase
VSFLASANRAAAATSGALAAAAVLALAAPASAGTARSATVPGSAAAVALSLRAMPPGTVTFAHDRRGHLTIHPDMFGLTPGSAHSVSLVIPGWRRTVRFSPLTANSAGQADSTLYSSFLGRPPRWSRVVVHMGVGGGRVASEPIAATRRTGYGHQRYLFFPVEVSPDGRNWGTPRGWATISYSARRHTLTVTVHASGLTPGPHAAHIHLGSCMSQGPIKYMLRDLIADRRGRVRHAVRVFTNVTAPIPARGWYLNIHQGNSGNIASNGQPTIFFRPLLCQDIHGAP